MDPPTMRTRPRASFPASFGSGLSAARTTRASSAADADRAVSAALRPPRPPDRGSSRLGAPVQRDRRLPRARTTDLDLAPADSANSETEHFRDGFLRGPATGKMQDVRA